MSKAKEYLSLQNHAIAQINRFKFTAEPCEIFSHKWRYIIQTPKAGVIKIHIDKDDRARGEPVSLSLFTQFENNLAAKALGFDSNQFSGKWNHHFLWSKDLITQVFDYLESTAF